MNTDIEHTEIESTEFAPVAITIASDLLQRILEGALLAAGKPLTVDDLGALFDAHARPHNDAIRAVLATISEQCNGRGFQLREVASGYRFQVIQEVAPWIARLWEEKPQRYSRALLETLALIAYRQPITRGDIEDIRGVAVASNIVKTLLEREWVRVVGHKDVPGRPAMYATTRKFLDYFNLQNLDDLPTLAEIRDLDSMNTELALEGIDTVMVITDPETGEDASDAELAFDTPDSVADTTLVQTSATGVEQLPSESAFDSTSEAEETVSTVDAVPSATNEENEA